MEAEMLLERAGLLLEQGRHRDAETQIRQALQLEPENPRAFGLMARCHLENQKYDDAIQAIGTAITLDPQNSFYFYLLGFAYLRKDQVPQASLNLLRAIELNPYVAEYFGLLGYVYLRKKMFEQALKTADDGLALDPGNLTCLNARSIALNKLRRTEDAISTMQSALAEDPDNEATHTTVGWNLLERGRNREAEQHFMEALRISPNFGDAKAGLKEALKSRILLYKWFLQYSFWVHNKGRNFRIALPIALYVTFRILLYVSGQNSYTEGLAWMIGGLYLLMVVVSWTIGSIANFVLLFNKVGKYALTATERWSAITVVAALVAGLATLAVSSFTSLASGTPYEESLFVAGLICISLALPLGSVSYPLRFGKKNWREWYSIGLVALGLVSLFCFPFAPDAALQLFVVYGIAFIAYTWTGIA